MMPAADLRARPPRSLLFVPADRVRDLLPKAEAAGPDAVIVDFEDAVLPARLAEARAGLRAAFESWPSRRPLFIRVNRPASPAFEQDVELAASLPGVGVVLPKCGGPEDVELLVRAWSALAAGELAVLPLVESARGILAAGKIASADPAVLGLALGAEDLAAEIGVRRTGPGDEILVARSWVVLAAAASGRWAIDTPCLELRREEVVRRDAGRAASLGFVGKLLVHPGQVVAVHAAFRPAAAEIKAARRTIATLAGLEAGGRGVGAMDGRMIDRPIVEAARRLLARATQDDDPGGEA
jgi:citrate lyase subunit beta / citryl-CoA lyase